MCGEPHDIFKIMGDEDERHSTVGVKRPEQVEDLVSAFTIQIAGWLVGQKHRRRIGQAASDGDALAFSAGKFGRIMIHSLFESNGLQ